MGVAHDSTKADVEAFWQTTPCGATHADAAEGTPEFYAQVARKREALEPFIAEYADFSSTRDQRVLEIGTGLGTDLLRFARAGALITGVDLTERAVRNVKQRLALEGLTGDLRVADAECLPFDDDTFDVVYSWGVLHHTPAPERAIAEAQRVLRPGGRLCVMLYARHSFVAFALWVRYALLAGRPLRSLCYVVGHHMESNGTRAYTRAELLRAFDAVEDCRVEHVGTPYDRRVAGSLARMFGSRLGWFLVVRGVKRASKA